MAAAAQAAPPQPLGCLIEPYQSSDVGSPVVGVIETLHVDRGDRVTRGQPLATLRSDVERSSVAVAESRAQAVGEVRAAEANAELARQKLVRAEDLARQQFISTQAVEQARAETRVADNRLAQAREQQGIYAREHDLARAQLGLRTIRSPSSGVIADRFMAAGERIVLVDRVIEGASNTFRIRLELPNPDRALPAGLRCKAEFSDVDAALTAPVRRAAPQAVVPATHPNGGMQLRVSPTLGAVPAGRP